jgi:hypothetical protein
VKLLFTHTQVILLHQGEVIDYMPLIEWFRLCIQRHRRERS